MRTNIQPARQIFGSAALNISAKRATPIPDTRYPIPDTRYPIPDTTSQLAALFQAGRYAELESRSRLLIDLHPDFGPAWKALSAALQAQGKDALSAMQKTTELLPVDAETRSNLGNALLELGQLDKAVASYRRALEIKPDFADAHYNLGNALKDLGQLDGAVASYRRALEIKPRFAAAHGNLGVALFDQGKLQESLACFRQQVGLTPDNGLAQHLIASMTGNNTERAPVQYVESVFDGYADKFDSHLQQKLEYDAPVKLVALITQHSTPPLEKWDVLDLGCGTGLVGSAIAPFARKLVGVDLSTKMLKKAHARNLYQRLEHLDLLVMMRAEKASSYDVIIAADVFIYLGKLDEIIGEVKRLLCAGGIFAFSIETLEVLLNEKAGQGSQRDYQLNDTGRYAQSASYITRLAAANGFLAREMSATQIRMERNKPVNGSLVLWNK